MGVSSSAPENLLCVGEFGCPQAYGHGHYSKLDFSLYSPVTLDWSLMQQSGIEVVKFLLNCLETIAPGLWHLEFGLEKWG